MIALHGTVLRGGIAALALLAVTATAQPARAQCFWDGSAWVCWTHPLFPELTLAPDANPYWRLAQNWGGIELALLRLGSEMSRLPLGQARTDGQRGAAAEG